MHEIQATFQTLFLDRAPVSSKGNGYAAAAAAAGAAGSFGEHVELV